MYLDCLTRIKNLQHEIEDKNKTIEQFRGRVSTLQKQLSFFEQKEEELAAEAKVLTTKSQALMDQNLQLQVILGREHF